MYETTDGIVIECSTQGGADVAIKFLSIQAKRAEDLTVNLLRELIEMVDFFIFNSSLELVQAICALPNFDTKFLINNVEMFLECCEDDHANYVTVKQTGEYQPWLVFALINQLAPDREDALRVELALKGYLLNNE